MAEQQAKQPDIIIPAMTAELLDVLEKRFPQIQLKLDDLLTEESRLKLATRSGWRSCIDWIRLQMQMQQQDQRKD